MRHSPARPGRYVGTIEGRIAWGWRSRAQDWVALAAVVGRLVATWFRAEMTCFRDQVPERCLVRCLVLALGVLKILSASVCLCSIVVGGCGVSVCSVSVYVSPWVCVLAFCMPRSVYARVRLFP